MKRNLLWLCFALVGMMSLSSCERNYYRNHHDHSPRWHRHHRDAVDVRIHT